MPNITRERGSEVVDVRKISWEKLRGKPKATRAFMGANAAWITFDNMLLQVV